MKYRLYLEIDSGDGIIGYEYQVLGGDGDDCLTEGNIGEDLLNIGCQLMDGYDAIIAKLSVKLGEGAQ